MYKEPSLQLELQSLSGEWHSLIVVQEALDAVMVDYKQNNRILKKLYWSQIAIHTP